MSKVNYTEEELNEFRELVDLLGSCCNSDRITGRIRMPKFVEEHGKEKCDAMFMVIEAEIEEFENVAT